jgi:galactonate dehydratase
MLPAGSARLRPKPSADRIFGGLAALMLASAAAQGELQFYRIVGDKIPASLTGTGGDPARGRSIVAMREGAGPDVDLLLDLNFNAKTEGYLKTLKAIADFDLFWVEIDSYNPAALAYIRRHSPHPISSCETLLGLREFLPYFRKQAMDVAIIDAVWNGVWQAMKISTAAEAFEVNIAPHNFYGHLATMMNAHFAAAVPNLRIMEIEIDMTACHGTRKYSPQRRNSRTVI